MSLIDILKDFKKSLVKNKAIEDKNIKKIYRLHYLYFSNYPVSEMHDWCCEAFIGPEGFSEDDIFKVTSYLFDRADRKTGSYRCCANTTHMLSEIGFTIIKNINKSEYKTVDLFSVSCNDRGFRFKQTQYYNDYFEWYQYGITKETIEEIYAKNNMENPFENKKKVLK